MKKVSLDTWIQLIGMLGILGGLVFVGLEMKQSQIIAIGGQIQARNLLLLHKCLRGVKASLLEEIFGLRANGNWGIESLRPHTRS